ncbi:MAG: hypothetical protein CFE44_28415 [Burkholderiales bacterium PBB4]|nr:MAG: hypothetical protein CFE44_28415 [Burkholderiales bacterium PBB4]
MTLLLILIRKVLALPLRSSANPKRKFQSPDQLNPVHAVAPLRKLVAMQLTEFLMIGIHFDQTRQGWLRILIWEELAIREDDMKNLNNFFPNQVNLRQFQCREIHLMTSLD